MKRGRHLLVVGVLGAAMACAIVAACTFPEVEFAPAGSVGEGGSGDGPNGTDAPDDVTSDIQILVDGSDPDALIEKDAGKKIDASNCKTCDCDEDGFDRPNCDGGSGKDCDDNDTRYRPDQTFNTEPEQAPLGGDWNCKDGVEKFYPTGVKCTDLGGGAQCDGTFGFQDNPKCGAPGTFLQCHSGGLANLNCVVIAKNLTTVQACR